MSAVHELKQSEQAQPCSLALYDPDAELERRYDCWFRKTGNPVAASILATATVPAGRVAVSAQPLETLNPPDVANLLRVSPSKVIGWIRSGELKAANIATGKRPRFVIHRDDLNTFLASRRPDPPAQRRRKIKTVSKRY